MLQRHHTGYNDTIQVTTTPYRLQRRHTGYSDIIKVIATPLNLHQRHHLAYMYSAIIQVTAILLEFGYFYYLLQMHLFVAKHD